MVDDVREVAIESVEGILVCWEAMKQQARRQRQWIESEAVYVNVFVVVDESE